MSPPLSYKNVAMENIKHKPMLLWSKSETWYVANSADNPFMSTYPKHHTSSNKEKIVQSIPTILHHPTHFQKIFAIIGVYIATLWYIILCESLMYNSAIRSIHTFVIVCLKLHYSNFFIEPYFHFYSDCSQGSIVSNQKVSDIPYECMK